MNFLALVQDLARQSGTLAGGVNLASVTGVTGRADKLVNWIASAWEDIQTQRKWNWLRQDFSHALLPNTARYTAASFNIARFGAWSEDTHQMAVMTLYDPAIGQADEGAIRQIPFDVWKVKYGRGAQTPNRPTEWAISPTGELCLGSVPDKAYVLSGEFWKSPQILAANTDTPECKAQYHKAIVYRAIELMAAADESVPTLSFARTEYARLFTGLCNDPMSLPAFSVRGDGPLA